MTETVRTAGAMREGAGVRGVRKAAAAGSLRGGTAAGRAGRDRLSVVICSQGDGKRRTKETGNPGVPARTSRAGRQGSPPVEGGYRKRKASRASPRGFGKAAAVISVAEAKRGEKRASLAEAKGKKALAENEGSSRFRLRTALVVVLLASLSLMLWVYMYTGVLNVGEVKVVGNRRLDAGYLRALSGITSRTHLLRMDVKAVERALLSEPYVAEVKVGRRFPRTVILQVREKEPMAVVMQNGKYHLVDSEGMVLESREERGGGLVEIPCRESRPLYPGVRLEDMDLPRFATIIREMPGALREVTESVGFQDGDGFFLRAADTMVVIGDTNEVARKLEIAWLALQEMSARYGRLAYVDVTYPDHPVIKPAE